MACTGCTGVFSIFKNVAKSNVLIIGIGQPSGHVRDQYYFFLGAPNLLSDILCAKSTFKATINRRLCTHRPVVFLKDDSGAFLSSKP